MTRSFCVTCNKNTGHKRTFGIGTLIGLVVTFGFLLFFLPFYPKRCVVCGNWHVFLPQPKKREYPPSSNTPDTPDTKTCPFCAETIKAAAVKCRYCGSDLPEGEQPKEEEEEYIPPGPRLHETNAERIGKRGLFIQLTKKRGVVWWPVVIGVLIALVSFSPDRSEDEVADSAIVAKKDSVRASKKELGLTADRPEPAKPKHPTAASNAPPRQCDGCIVEIQTLLERKGYSAGPADGSVGRNSKAAIREFQKDQGLPVDGIASLQLLDTLRRKSNATRSTSEDNDIYQAVAKAWHSTLAQTGNAQNVCTVHDPTGLNGSVLIESSEAAAQALALLEVDETLVAPYILCKLEDGDRVSIQHKLPTVTSLSVVKSATCPIGEHGLTFSALIRCDASGTGADIEPLYERTPEGYHRVN